MKKLIIIGGGPAGNVAALTAAAEGRGAVVLIEKDAMGGTCTNRGCIPSKFFLSRTGAAGHPGQPALDWPRMVAHKNALVRGLSRSIEEKCLKAGVEIVRGQGRFSGPHRVQVTGREGKVIELEGESIIVATGSAPARIPGLPVDGKAVLTSTEALELEKPPRSIVIIGSGPVGAEFAFIFHHAGSRVTIVEALERLFPLEDQDVHQLFEKLFSRMGVEVVTGDAAASITIGSSGKPRIALRSGKVLEPDQVLVSIGRRLLTEDLGLEHLGLETGPRGEIPVDDELRTSRSHIFAVGDITGKQLLAHLASFQGEQAARHAVGRGGRAVPYHAVPWATYTSPEIASVGVTEEAAKRQGLEYLSARVPFMDNVKARIDRATEGFVKMVAEKGTGRILGGTIVGPQSSDQIHTLAAAVQSGSTVSDLSGMVFAHPTLAESILDATVKLREAQRGESTTVLDKGRKKK